MKILNRKYSMNKFKLGSQVKSPSRILAVFLVFVALSVMPAAALINGTEVAGVNTGITLPQGMVFLPGALGGHWWLSDVNSGFCRLDPDPITGLNAINVNTCIMGIVRKNFPGPVKPGGFGVGATNPDGTTFIYVPDSAATQALAALGHNSGVWRLRFDPVREAISAVDLLVSVSALQGDKPVAVDLDSAGNLYVGYQVHNAITKVTIPPNAVLPLTAANVVPFFGTTVFLGVNDIAVAKDTPPGTGEALYIAEKVVVVNGLSKISLNRGGNASFFGIAFPVGFSPTALTPSPDGDLFIANTPGGIIQNAVSTIDKYNITSDILTPLYTTGLLQAGGTTSLGPVTAVSTGQGFLMIQDDTSAGLAPAAGRLWSIPVNAPANTNANQFSPFGATGVTFPQAVIFLPNSTGGGHLWLGTGDVGFCRLDLHPGGAGGIYSFNPATCILGIPAKGVPGAVAPGQVVLDPVPNADGTRFIYVPDLAVVKFPDRMGIWRYTFDPVSETIPLAELLVNVTTLGADLPDASALDAAGNLYIGYIRSDNITKINNTRAVLGAFQTLNRTNVIPRFGAVNTQGLKGAINLAVANPPPFGGPFLGATQALYLTPIAVGFGLKAIPLPAGGLATSFGTAPISNFGRSPTGVVASPDGASLIIADTPGGFVPGTFSTIVNFTIATSIETPFSTTGVFVDGTTTVPSYPMIIGLGLHPVPGVNGVPRVFAGEDLSAGLNVGTGHAWVTGQDFQPPGGRGDPTAYPGLQTAAKAGDTVTLNANLFDITLDPIASAFSGIKNASVNVTQINAASGIVPMVPGAVTPIGEGPYSAAVTVTNTTDGINLLNVTDFDNADTWNGFPPVFNASTTQVKVIVDNTKPVLTGIPQTIGANQINLVSANAADPLTNGVSSGVTSVTADVSQLTGLPNGALPVVGMSLTGGNATNGTWQMAVSPNASGTFTLPIVATDGAGNTNTSTISLTVVLPPAVTANLTQVRVGIAANVSFNVTNNSIPVPNATVTLSGNATGTGITDVNGSTVISVNATATGIITVTATNNPPFNVNPVTTITAVPAVLKGDVNLNAVLDVADGLVTLQAVAGLRTLTPLQISAADVNANGVLDVSDGLFILQAVAGTRVL